MILDDITPFEDRLIESALAIQDAWELGFCVTLTLSWVGYILIK